MKGLGRLSKPIKGQEKRRIQEGLEGKGGLLRRSLVGKRAHMGFWAGAKIYPGKNLGQKGSWVPPNPGGMIGNPPPWGGPKKFPSTRGPLLGGGGGKTP